MENSIWTASGDGKINIWNVEKRSKISTLLSKESTDSVKCLIQVKLPDETIQVWSSSPKYKTINCWDPEVCFLIKIRY